MGNILLEYPMQHFGGSLAMHEQGERKERKHLVAVSPFPPLFFVGGKRKTEEKGGKKFSPLYNVRKQNPKGKQRKGSSPYSSFPTLFFSSFFVA